MSIITWRNVGGFNSAGEQRALTEGRNAMSDGIDTLSGALESLAGRGQDNAEKRFQQDVMELKQGYQTELKDIRATADALETDPVIGRLDMNTGEIDFASKKDYLEKSGLTGASNADELYELAKDDAKLAANELSNRISAIPQQESMANQLSRRALDLGYSPDESDQIGNSIISQLNSGRGELNEYDQFNLAQYQQAAQSGIEAAEIARDKELANIDATLAGFAEITKLSEGTTPAEAIFRGLQTYGEGLDTSSWFNVLDSSKEDFTEETIESSNKIAERLNEAAVSNPYVQKILNRWNFKSDAGAGKAAVPNEILALAMRDITFDEDGEILTDTSDGGGLDVAMEKAADSYDQYRKLQQEKFDVQERFRKAKTEQESLLLKRSHDIKGRAADRDQVINLRALNLNEGFKFSE